MPIVKERPILGTVGRLPIVEEDEAPSFLETLGAGFRLGNAPVSVIIREPTTQVFTGPFGETRPGLAEFDPFENITGYEDHAISFAFATNANDVATIKRNIDRETEDRATLEAAGAGGMAALFAAGMLDPILLFPVGGVALKSASLGKSVLQSGLVTARAGLLGSTASEAVLAATQETLTGEEAAFNIAASTFLSGILGAAVPVVARALGRSPRALADDVARDLEPGEGPDLREAGSFKAPDEEFPGAPVKAEAPRTTPDEPEALVGEIFEGELQPAFLMSIDELDVLLKNKRRTDKEKLLIALGSPERVKLFKKLDRARNSSDTSRADAASVRFNEEFGDLTPQQEQLIFGIGETDLQIDGIKALRSARGDADAFALDANEDIAREVAFGMRNSTPADLKKLVERGTGPADVQEQFIRISAGITELRKRDLAQEDIDELILQGMEGMGFSRADGLEVISDFLTLPSGKTARAASKPAAIEDRADISEDNIIDLPTEQARRLTEDDLPENPIPPLEETGSVGAATANETLAENTLKSALGVEKALAFEDPLLRSATSPFLAARRAIQELARSPFIYRKNQLGIASPQSVEVMIDAWQFPLAEMLAETDRLFVKYRTGRAEGRQGSRLVIQARDIAGTADDKLTFHKFKQEVAKAMRRGDTHPIPEVNELAKKYRDDLFDPLKDRAIKAGLLPEDVEVNTALSYMMRVYNTEKIVSRRPEFVRIVQGWLARRRDADARRVTVLESDLATALARTGKSDAAKITTLSDEIDQLKGRAGLEDIELEDVAQQITDRILGTPDGRLPYDVTADTPRRGKGRERPGARGPLKARVFAIEDELIESFLENDIELISRIYTRTMASDSELASRFGSIDMVTQIDDIRREAARAVTQSKTERERRRLDRLKNQAIRDIAAVRDRLRGTYGSPVNPRGVGVRAARVFGQISLLSKLGGVLISSLPDIARPVMTEGLGRVVRHALIPLVANSRQFRVARQEAKFLGNVTERILDSRIGAIADVAEGYGRFTKFERGTQKLTDTFGMVTLLSPWNQFWKEFTGVVTMSRIIDVSQQWSRGTIAPRDIERMAASGIDQPMAQRIAKEFASHGIEDRGIFIPGTSTWTDAEARLALRNAVTLEVDNTIVTPGVGQRPLWMSTTGGRLIGQFKSFSFASTQSVLIAGLQRRDAATLNGMMLSVMGGMLVYALKQHGAGRELSDDPAIWMSEGVDRSGLTGILFDVNDMVERATRGTIGISAITGGPASSRFAARNTAGAVLGPSFGMSQDLIQVLGATATADFRQSDTRALRRLLPYQNLFYIRQLLDAAEERVNDELGISR